MNGLVCSFTVQGTCLFLQVRILVTHGIAFLPHFDHIIVMTDGFISEVGVRCVLMYFIRDLLFVGYAPQDWHLQRAITAGWCFC